MATQTNCTIRIDGRDVSTNIMPRLISLSISDKAGASSDTVSIVLDDTNGVIALPREGAKIEVDLGAADKAGFVFRGVIDEVKSIGSKSGGRELSISGNGFDTRGKPKQSHQKHWDDKTLGDVFAEAARLGGVDSVKVDDSLASITRPYWAMQGESFIAFGERIAREVGGTFKVSDNVAVLAARNSGKSAGGKTLATVRAEFGVNLISWDIAVILGRARYVQAKARWYDTKAGTWRTENVEIDDDVNAEFSERFASADGATAKSQAGARKVEADRGRGGGSITITGNAEPKPEGQVEIVGARPGIDGTYRIDGVNHDYTKSGGWLTRIDLAQPQGGAGKDERKPTKPNTKK